MASLPTGTVTFLFTDIEGRHVSSSNRRRPMEQTIIMGLRKAGLPEQ